ncbi:MAG: 16S rRNA (guanine(527)-N(7))-methyltransferase RsmG [Burkholderiales bacterium]|nr:16S rRNA (guanine(527)-N(7))-methyltransferase RsmG [Burkholderiales bacterium]MDE1926303.1 16S rRNA (guanine(527)-N(7))-methyltransferase RsmG [Burkholderiales bacterium]MDE2159466.1 16S rRNA (guanine(527)-N(7))-methyltransferase RsmG [Burkholderiales bacterium]MDE2501471.1 16S rRNA (guanine(527)-N(7))-methyltransferase RsmG [Burkholderiales bacterium]
MTADPRSRLQAIADELGVDLGDREGGRLLDYLALLQRWNAVYNLTAVRDPEAMLVQHLADCLAVMPSLRRRLPAGRLLDVGSGGGLPGVVIASLIDEVDVTCVDTVGKKVAFLRQVAGVLGLRNLKAVHGRVETLRSEPFEVITSRAFASLGDFTRLTEGLLAVDGAWMALKGRVPGAEIAALPAAIEMFHVEPLEVPGLDAQRCLVWMRKRREG